MDRKAGFQTSKRDMSITGHSSSNIDVPTEVLFMDSQGMSSKANTHPPPSAYYQVATPKSPHELTFAEEEGGSGKGDNHGVHDGGIVDNGVEDPHRTDMGKSSGDSEEIEKLKYEMAKAEILDKLHLHTLIGNKEVQTIQKEICRTEAQMNLLKTLHDDEKLLDKIEAYQEKQIELRKGQLVDVNLSGYYADYSGSVISSSGSSTNVPLSTSSNIPVHHYHTRSKSQGNLSETAHLRPANPSLMNIRMDGSKSVFPGSGSEEGQIFRPNQMNMHHRRNYSSTCLTSNSGVVGKNEQNEAIFRRYDGVLIVITCSHCGRRGFMSAQGIVNHARLKHNKTYSSQPLAVLNNQVLLPTEKQNPEVLEKFKKLGRDLQKEYLPSEVAIPSINKKESASKQGLPNQQQQQQQQQQQHGGRQSVADSTRHLKEVYAKDDFQDLVDMVNTAPQDLQDVLKESSINSSTEPSEGEQEPKSPTPHRASSPLSPSRETLKKNNKRRKQAQNEALRLYKDRMRPAEKKARPDVLALSAIPEHEKRSSHYNLRAKSKLRAHSNRFD